MTKAKYTQQERQMFDTIPYVAGTKLEIYRGGLPFREVGKLMQGSLRNAIGGLALLHRYTTVDERLTISTRINWERLKMWPAIHSYARALVADRQLVFRTEKYIFVVSKGKEFLGLHSISTVHELQVDISIWLRVRISRASQAVILVPVNK